MPLSDLFDPHPSDATVIACDLSVLDDPEHHGRSFSALLAEREELRKVPGGLALRYPGTMEYAERILDYISRERQCCPFLTFEIIVEPEGRGIWWYFGGDERVEAYLYSQFDARASQPADSE